MKAGQRFGPFVIEKVLGSGAMGTVYRALYTKTGGRVALKVMAPGLSDNANSLRRFVREAQILKQLHHPNIVRFYGGRVEGHTPFYAMEYVEGESLDRVKERRDRMTWEELVTFGQQLCSALQHAHEHGIIHRDLKPSNLMVLADGTVKLTDFGIAKDMDLTGLTGANCTVGTASYMSPEQCRGERDLTPRSDLYSLGVVFYELLTGKKPFHAETPMEMFLQHLNGTFERPSRLVLDTPVWLDTLICQLLEKDPKNRPRDAEMVAQSLGQVAEKVAALQSAGVDAIRKRVIDRPRGAARPDDTDREAARTLKQAVTGKKLRRRRKRSRWFVAGQAVILVVLLLLGGGALYLGLRPPRADSLYTQAEAFMRSADKDERQKAIDRDGPITLYFRNYGDRDDAQSRQMHQWADELGTEQRRDKLTKLLNSHDGKTVFKIEPLPGAETQALQAAVAEEDGDLSRARQAWQELVQKYPREGEDRSWVLLAEQRLKDVQEAEALAARIDAADRDGKDLKAESDLEQKVADTAKRARGAEPARARECWQDLRAQNQTESGSRVLALLAADRLFKMKKTDHDGKAQAAPEKKPKDKK